MDPERGGGAGWEWEWEWGGNSGMGMGWDGCAAEVRWDSLVVVGAG